MSLKKTEIKSFDIISQIIGFKLQCTCHRDSPDVCRCDGICFCSTLKTRFGLAVHKYVVTGDVKLIIDIFTDLEYTGFTMLDCADFIHRVEEKKNDLRLVYGFSA